jgi:hypothetical protein
VKYPQASPARQSLGGYALIRAMFVGKDQR